MLLHGKNVKPEAGQTVTENATVNHIQPYVSNPFIELSADTLRDKVRGGLLGQILGNLNGLKHENKYINEPGNIEAYIPALPEGAWTDDDTDFEWVYIVEMQRANDICLSPQCIADLWKGRINKRLWCANQYARQLMDLGLTPPLTGTSALNPWADFNISGQFLCETFGLLAPGMTQTAARIGLNYTSVAIDLEPAQTTQLFTAMIATAFVTDDLEKILDAGVNSLDPHSAVRQIIRDVRDWHRRYRCEWRTTRRLMKEKYTRHNGTVRDYNGYELNTGVTVAAFLYGEGDFVKTLLSAFNFGWDCDNSAATAGTIVGVIKGYRWMMSQGWQIVDRYRNTTRENMPNDETITSFADRIIDLAERVIVAQGGRRIYVNGKPVYHIILETPASVIPLPDPAEQITAMRSGMKSEIETGIISGNTAEERARAAYLAICLDLAEPLRKKYPAHWAESLDALNGYWNVVQALYYHADFPAGEILRTKADAAGLQRPGKKEKLW